MSLLAARTLFAQMIYGRRAVSDALAIERAMLGLQSVSGDRYPETLAEAERRYLEGRDCSFADVVQQVRDDVALGRL